MHLFRFYLFNSFCSFANDPLQSQLLPWPLARLHLLQFIWSILTLISEFHLLLITPLSSLRRSGSSSNLFLLPSILLFCNMRYQPSTQLLSLSFLFSNSLSLLQTNCSLFSQARHCASSLANLTFSSLQIYSPLVLSRSISSLTNKALYTRVPPSQPQHHLWQLGQLPSLQFVLPFTKITYDIPLWSIA